MDAVYCWNCKSDQSKCRPVEAASPLQSQAQEIILPSTHFGGPMEKVKCFEEFVEENDQDLMCVFMEKRLKRESLQKMLQ